MPQLGAPKPPESGRSRGGPKKRPFQCPEWSSFSPFRMLILGSSGRTALDRGHVKTRFIFDDEAVHQIIVDFFF